MKENASSLDICALFVEGRRLLRTCGNVSTLQWKANDKSFYVTRSRLLVLTNTRALLDHDSLLSGSFGGVDVLPHWQCLHFSVLLPPMLVQPADHREPWKLPRYDGAVHRSSSRLRHMFTDLIDSFLICRISDWPSGSIPSSAIRCRVSISSR